MKVSSQKARNMIKYFDLIWFTKRKARLRENIIWKEFRLRLSFAKKLAINFIRIQLAPELCEEIISDKSDKSVSFFISNTECTKETKAFDYSVSSVFMFILTTDIQDLTDANHERKRAYP